MGFRPLRSELACCLWSYLNAGLVPRLSRLLRETRKITAPKRRKGKCLVSSEGLASRCSVEVERGFAAVQYEFIYFSTLLGTWEPHAYANPFAVATVANLPTLLEKGKFALPPFLSFHVDVATPSLSPSN